MKNDTQTPSGKKNIFQKIAGTVHFLRTGIWQKDEHDYRSPAARWVVRQTKVLIYTVQGYNRHGIMIRSASLTFYTLMSLVPIAAMFFGIAKGFSLDARLTEYLYKEFPQYTALIDQVTKFAEALLERTHGGLLASVGLVMLLWSAMKVFMNVENAFNNIWEVHKERNLARRFSDYLAVLLIGPIFAILSASLSLYIDGELFTSVRGVILTPLLKTAMALVPFLFSWIILAVLYILIPYTRVKFRSAFPAAMVSGTAFQLFQIGYFYVQSSVSSYNAIYGSFAALPMFLIWMQVSWQIILFGAELSFAYQNITKYEYEREFSHISYEYKKKILLLVMYRIVTNFRVNAPSLTAAGLSDRLNLPVRIVRDVLFELEQAGLIVAYTPGSDKEHHYIPARDIHSLTIYDVLKDVEAQGIRSIDLEPSEDLLRVSEILDKFDRQDKNSEYNIKLADL